MPAVERQPAVKRRSRDEIVAIAIEMFADRGFASVSMRDLAAACDMTPAALYHHFPDKSALYLEAVRQALLPKMGGLQQVLEQSTTIETMVRLFVTWFVDLVHNDQNFHRLLARELLDVDHYRLDRISERVLGPSIHQLADLCDRFLPGENPYLIGFSVMSLVLGHFQLDPIRRNLGPEELTSLSQQEITDHIVEMVLHGLSLKQRATAS